MRRKTEDEGRRVADEEPEVGDRGSEVLLSPSPPFPLPPFELEHGHAEYSDAELLEQAAGNAQALLLGTIAFLQSRQIAPREWAEALGETFSRAWGPPRVWDASELLDAMLTNLRSLGAEVEAAQLDVDRAEAVISGFPDAELCLAFGVAPADVADFHAAAGVIAAQRGLRWGWELLPDGRTRFVVERSE